MTTCPVCNYPCDDTSTGEICPCCGTEFGYHDANTPHAELRAKWIDGGCVFRHEREKPAGWDAAKQLDRVE